MKNEISALIDGELAPDALGSCVQRIRHDDDLRRAWDEYHLIGDALRGDIRPALDERFALRLAAEPTALAPRPSTSSAAANSRWLAAFSAAAGVAAVAVAAWVSLPLTAVDTAAVPLAAVTSAPVVAAAPAQADGGNGVPVAVGVEDYLLAHQRFSPAGNMQGVAPYVRTVSAERNNESR